MRALFQRGRWRRKLEKMSPATGQGGPLPGSPFPESGRLPPFGQCMHFLPQIQRHMDVVSSALSHHFNPKDLITQKKVGLGRCPLLESGPPRQVCWPPGSRPLERSSGEEGEVGLSRQAACKGRCRLAPRAAWPTRLCPGDRPHSGASRGEPAWDPPGPLSRGTSPRVLPQKPSWPSEHGRICCPPRPPEPK